MKKLPKTIISLTLTLLFLPFLASAVVPAAPENLLPGWLFGDIILTWDQAPLATSYNVYRYDEASSTWTTAATGLTAPYYREANVLDPTSYTVSALNAEGESPVATPVVTQETGEWLYMVFTSGPDSFYDTKAVISWSVSLVAGADGTLEVGTSPTNMIYIGRDTNYATFHQFTVTNLLPQTTYYCRITSVGSNRTGVSGWTYFSTLPPNRPPVISDSTIYMYEDNYSAANFWVNAYDPDGQRVTLTVVSGPAHGTLTEGIYGNYSYAPDTNWFGTETITFVASDGQSTSAPGTVTIEVWPMDDPPVAIPASAVTGEGMPVEIALQASDLEGDLVSFRIYSSPTNGWAEATEMKATYHPRIGFVGTDTFWVFPDDGLYYGQAVPVTVSVTNVNAAPKVETFSITAHAGTSYYGSFLASDEEGDPITCEIVSGPARGTVSVSGTHFIYTPDPEMNFNDSFTYRGSDGMATGAEATVWVQVGGTNQLPQAQDQNVIVIKNREAFFGLNAQDPDGDPLRAVLLSTPTNGSVEIAFGYGIHYRPQTNFLGLDSFIYQVTDGSGTSTVATVILEVIPNRPPVADPQSFTLPEDWSAGFSLSGSDPDGDPVSVVLLTGPAHGKLFATNPNYLYTPDPNFHGMDSFTFTVNDGATNGNIVTVDITVTPVNDPPVRVSPDRTFTIAEDSSKDFDTQATDVDGDTLTYTIVTPPAHGTVTRRSATTWTYEPALNWSGNDQLTWVASDGDTNCAAGKVSFQVTAVNDRPVAGFSFVTNAEDTPIVLTLNGVDVEGAALTYSIVTPPSHGTLSGSGANVLYTPAPNYVGQDTFVFKVNDGSLDSLPATVTITLTNVNDAPVAGNQTITTSEDTPVSITLTGADIDGDALTAFIVSGPAHGTVTLVGLNLVYTPSANFNGNDSFTFSVNDGTTNGNTATVSITVTLVNDAPVASSQSVSTAEDTPLNITMLGSDVDGDTLTYSIVRGPTNGYLNVTGGPTRLYTPNGNFHGSDSFEFKVTDSAGLASTGQVSITVTSVNDAPVSLFNGMTISAVEDTARQVLLSADDYDGDALTYIIVNPPAHGTVSGPGPLVTYIPAPNYNGPDSFSWKASDGTAQSAVAVINVNVAAVNDVPVANGQSLTTSEDTPLGLTLTGSDVDGDTLSFVIVSVPAKGTLSGTAPNLIYTPNPNATGSDSFTFKVNDGTVYGNVATVNLTIIPVNDAPVANAQTVSTAYNTSLNITLAGTDVEGSPLTFTIVSNPANGTLTGTGPNKTFSPNIGWSGTTTFSFKVNDGALDSSVAGVTITVAPPSSIPAVPSGLTAAAASSTQINLAWTDTAANEDGFKIERSTDNRTFTQIATVGPNVQSFASAGLASNKTYYYRVQGFNSLGNSGYSGTVSAKTLK